MKKLVILVSLVAFAFVGCGRKRRSDVDMLDDVAAADTAAVDANLTPESLPTVDEPEVQPDSKTASSTLQAEIDESLPVAEVHDSPPIKDNNSKSESINHENMSVAGSGEFDSYTVAAGDTLMKISYNVYGDINQWKVIYDLNKDKLKTASALVAGTVLKIEKPATAPVLEKNGDPYLIKKGDTLGTIADDIYAKKSKWKKLWENNKTLIHDPNHIYAGFYLYYQITEEEKKEAEEIKAKRGSGLSQATAQPVSRSPASSPSPSATDTAAPQAIGGVNTAGGLSGLAQ